jgi:hypothetical protein
MSAISFSFRPDAIPAYAQSEFLTRFFQLVLEYQTLTAPVPQAPPAETLPQPSEFVPVNGDEPEAAPVAEKPKKERKNPWANLTEEQRAERLAAMKRGREMKAAERRLSADSLEAAIAAVSTEAPAAAPASDTSSETSSKKQRKNPWANYTPEQHAERVARMKATRKAYLEGVAAAEAANESALRAEVAAEVAAAAPAPAPADTDPNAIRALYVAAAERAATRLPVPAPVQAASSDEAASETSSKKRKNPWEGLTEEQRLERIAKMKAGRAAKKAARQDGPSV